MSRSDHWERLGIAPTDDPRAVKRAYARILKTIDVDADPDAFIRLRSAMEAALAWGTQTAFWDEDGDADWLDDASDAPAAGGLEEAAVAETEVGEIARAEPPARVPDGGGHGVDALCAELERLLFDEEAPDPARIAALGAEILAHPALDSVDGLVAVEQVVAQAIASAIPRSDPLIEPAWKRFGWREAGRGWKRDWSLHQIVQRRNDLAFLAQCERRYDLHRAALDALRSPPPRRLGLLKLGLAGQVEAFLRVVDAERPTIEHDLDPRSLAWWRNYLENPSLPANFWPAIIGAPIILAFGFMMFVAAKSDTVPSPLICYPVALAATLAALIADARLRARARRRAGALAETGSARTLWPFAIVMALPLAATWLPDNGWPPSFRRLPRRRRCLWSCRGSGSCARGSPANAAICCPCWPPFCLRRSSPTFRCSRV